MSPGYLQINPYFNENASKLNRQGRSSNEKPENESDIKSKDAAALDHKFAVKDNIEDKLVLNKTLKEESERKNLEQAKSKSAEKTLPSDSSLREKEEDYREKAVIEELKKAEREVLSHEAAHVAAGGRFVGSPKYTREKGPDGKSYITGGEVPITVPPSDNPEEMARNMRQVKAAALAPINPSSQDINVAAAAANAQAQAEAELAVHKAEWGMEPQPARNNFKATDRIPTGVPMVKKYHSSVNSEEPGGVLSSISQLMREALNEVKTSTDSVSMTENELKYSRLAPEDNLYNTRQAMRVYYMTSSPKGLWTVDNGFEKISSSPALKQAQFLNIAA